MKNLMTLLVSCCFVANVYAGEGYLSTAHHKSIKDGYGGCIHTSYFDQDVDGLQECDEGPVNKEVVNDAKSS